LRAAEHPAAARRCGKFRAAGAAFLRTCPCGLMPNFAVLLQKLTGFAVFRCADARNAIFMQQTSGKQKGAGHLRLPVRSGRIVEPHSAKQPRSARQAPPNPQAVSGLPA